MLEPHVEQNQIFVGERFHVSFQRTLRIPDDGKVYPLPPGLGRFPVLRVADYSARVPESWRLQGGFFIPMYQREALWLAFGGTSWKPNAVKVGVGRVNAISGESWDERLHDDPQDYIVSPQQPWLDGINAGSGYIRQFVAVPLGEGMTVESEVTGKELFGGIQISVFEPKPGRFPDEPPVKSDTEAMFSFAASADGEEMGLGAGGRMKQKIYPDPYGVDTWDQNHYDSIFIHLANSKQYESVTGLKPLLTPVSAQTYTAEGYPWFDLYDEDMKDVAAPKKLACIKSIDEVATDGMGLKGGSGVVIDESQIKKVRLTSEVEKNS